MKTAIVVVATFVFCLLQNSAAAGISFEATPNHIYPLITKSSTLKCEVIRNAGTGLNTTTYLSKRLLQSAISASKSGFAAFEKTLRQVHEHTSAQPNEHTPPPPNEHTPPHKHTPPNEHTSPPSNEHTPPNEHTRPNEHTSPPSNEHTPTTETFGSTEYLKFVNGSLQIDNSTQVDNITTTNTPRPSEDSTHGDITHIVSIIISTRDKTTGHLKNIAFVSPFDQAQANVDVENIHVTGSTELTNTTEQGYLQVSWDYPTVDQAGSFVCQVYALNEELKPVTLSSTLNVASSAITLSAVAAVVSQQEKQLDELQQALANITTQFSRFKFESQIEYDLLQNTTKTLLNKTSNIQNIQTGLLSCSTNTSVHFSQPYNEVPEVFVSIFDFALTYTSSSSYGISIQQLTNTGFVSSCSGNYVTVRTVKWISVGK